MSTQPELDQTAAGLQIAVKNQLTFTFARDVVTATERDWWLASSKAALSVVIKRMIATMAIYAE
jgi:hypothetical protein